MHLRISKQHGSPRRPSSLNRVASSDLNPASARPTSSSSSFKRDEDRRGPVTKGREPEFNGRVEGALEHRRWLVVVVGRGVEGSRFVAGVGPSRPLTRDDDKLPTRYRPQNREHHLNSADGHISCSAAVFKLAHLAVRTSCQLEVPAHCNLRPVALHSPSQLFLELGERLCDWSQ